MIYYFDKFKTNFLIVSEIRCFSCEVDYESDLKLAAELGKSLLERNEVLEGNLRLIKDLTLKQ